MEPEGRQGNPTLQIGAQAGPRRRFGSTQQQVVWAQRGSHYIDIQCYRYYATDPADTSPITNTRHDSNYLMYRYVEGEGMSPQAALQRVFAEDAELGRLVALMVAVSSL